MFVGWKLASVITERKEKAQKGEVFYIAVDFRGHVKTRPQRPCN